MKVTVPQAKIAKTNVQQVKVGEVKIGPVKIDKLVLNNVRVQASTGIAEMRNVRVELTLKFGLNWSIGLTIEIPWAPDIDISRSGTLDLGTIRLGIGFPNLTLPGLDTLSFDIPSLPVTNIQAVVGPITNLNLGAVVAEQIKAAGVTAPKQGFVISGLSLASVQATGLGIPAASVDQATVGRVTGGALPLSNLSIPNFALPQASIPAVTSRNIAASTTPETIRLPEADIGILSAQLKVTTTARLLVGELRLDNISARASMGEIALTNITLPYELLNLTLSQIGIETIEVPQVEVS